MTMRKGSYGVWAVMLLSVTRPALADVVLDWNDTIRNVMKRETKEQQVVEMILANTRRIEELEALLEARTSFGPKRSPGTA